MAEKNLYIGVDLNDKYALLSYFTETMTEPETVSTIAGSEIYQIPLSLYKKKGIGQWYFGQDAKNMAKAEGGACIDDLYRRAYETEKIEIEEKFYYITFSSKNSLTHSSGIRHSRPTFTAESSPFAIILRTC